MQHSLRWQGELDVGGLRRNSEKQKELLIHLNSVPLFHRALKISSLAAVRVHTAFNSLTLQSVEGHPRPLVSDQVHGMVPIKHLVRAFSSRRYSCDVSSHKDVSSQPFVPGAKYELQACELRVWVSKNGSAV